MKSPHQSLRGVDDAIADSKTPISNPVDTQYRHHEKQSNAKNKFPADVFRRKLLKTPLKQTLAQDTTSNLC